MSSPERTTSSGFSRRVQQCFGRQASHYERHARLQAAIAWRLARHCRELPLPDGPRADLGSGTGLLARGLEAQWARPGQPTARPPLWRVDHCPELLAQERLQQNQAPQLPWDLNLGLPPQLQGASLLASNFALQWLEEPAAGAQLRAPMLKLGGWLALAVPTNGSFAAWREAAAQADVPFTGLALPSAAALEQVGRQQLELRLCQRLSFSRSSSDPASLLRQIRATGAQASRHSPLRPGELRRLLLHWPNSSASPLEWEVLLLLGQKP